jgi:hypothetical protein
MVQSFAAETNEMSRGIPAMQSKLLHGAASIGAFVALIGCGGGGSSGRPPADTTPPDTTITGGPTASTTQTSASFVLASNESNTTYEVSLDGAAYAAVSSQYQVSGLADGVHSLNARAKDAARNLDTTPATFSWTVDTTAPTVTLQFPGLSAYTDQSSIRLRGTAIDANQGTITNITVNGDPVTTSDAFRHWTATVNVATGLNTYTIASTDTLGNTDSTAATVKIRNHGVVVRSAESLAFDSARNRLLVASVADQRIVAIRLSDGFAEEFSGAQRGTGPLAYSGNLVMDAPRNRLLVREYTRTIAIDLDTGDRIDASAPQPNVYSTRMDYDAANDTAYDIGYQSVFATELASNTRRAVSSNTIGTGPAFQDPEHVLVDTSAAGGGQRLLVDDAAAQPYTDLRRILAVDIATGNRTVLYSSAPTPPSSGVVSNWFDSMTLDAPNNRVLVSMHTPLEGARVFAIDLATGNRSELATSDGLPGAAGAFTYDGVAGRGFLSLADRGRVQRLDPTTRQFSPLYEALAGSGEVTWNFNNLEVERQNDVITLIVPVQTSVYGYAGVLRINPVTGSRTLLTGGSILRGGNTVGTPVGTGPALRFAESAFVDTRSTAINAPSERLVVVDQSSGTSVISVDLASGNRSLLGSSSGTALAFDGQSSRLFAQFRAGSSTPVSLVALDIASGASSVISGSVGSGPGFTEGNIGSIAGLIIDRPASGPTRLIVASTLGRILAIDPGSGDRTLLFPPGNPAVIPQYITMLSMDMDPARQRAYVLSSSGAICSVELAAGVLELVSGSDPYFPNSMGAGPILSSGSELRLDSLNDVIYVASGSSLIAVDPSTGQRAIVSR